MLLTFSTLKQYYKDELLPNGLNLALISLHYNKRDYSIVMQATDDREDAQFNNPIITGYNLTFDKVGANQNREYELKLNNRFQIPDHLNKKDYFNLRDFFEIPSNRSSKSGFTLSVFFNEIDASLKFKNYSQCTRTEKSKIFDLSNPNAIYFKGLKNWDIINRSSDKKPHHVTLENRNKTSILLPKLYSRIKNRDISVIYTSDELTSNDEKKLIEQRLNTNQLQ